MVLSSPENSWNQPHSVNTQGAGRECSVCLLPNPHSCQSPKRYSGDTVPSQILYHTYRVKGELPKQYCWVPFIFFASHDLSYSYVHKKHKYSLNIQKPTNFRLQQKCLFRLWYGNVLPSAALLLILHDKIWTCLYTYIYTVGSSRWFCEREILPVFMFQIGSDL